MSDSTGLPCYRCYHQVITRRDEESGGKLQEPVEEAVVEVPEEHVGQVRSMLSVLSMLSVHSVCNRS